MPPFVSVVSKKRARGPQEDDSAAEHMDLTNDVDDDKANGFKVSPPIGAEEIAVKDEEVEIPLDAYPEAAKAEEEDEKPDLKPTLKVKCTSLFAHLRGRTFAHKTSKSSRHRIYNLQSIVDRHVRLSSFLLVHGSLN